MTRANEFLLTIAFFEVAPVCRGGLCQRHYVVHVWRLLCCIYTVAIYVYFTVRVTEWRIRFRREMNMADEVAATRAVDLNYETVKYFNAEDVEAERYDQAMANYEAMAVRSHTSLSAVNIGHQNGDDDDGWF